jgi:anti-sigma factor RsiW
MTSPIDPIVDADLQAFVDGQLSAERRMEVEKYLAAHPDAAARVMADLHGRDELRLAFRDGAGRARPDTAEAAQLLAHGLARLRLMARLRRVAAMAALITLGWFAHAELGPLAMTDSAASPQPPAFVEAAMMSHRTALMRATMRSQPQVHDYDADEMRAATGIVMPDLPREWQLVDVQVFPSSHGPSVELVVAAPDIGTVSLYAARPGNFAVIVPTPAPIGDQGAVYWQVGESAYALIGAADSRVLARAAAALATQLQ